MKCTAIWICAATRSSASSPSEKKEAWRITVVLDGSVIMKLVYVNSVSVIY